MSETDPIYLDHNATTPVLPQVVDAMLPYLRHHFGNPSSAHALGRTARAAVDNAREKVAALLGCTPSEILFTSGGTEANNLAIRGSAMSSSPRKQIVTSVIEHPATEVPCQHLEQHGFQVRRVPVGRTGRVIVDEALAQLRDETVLVTIMHANNETGTLQPLPAISRAARARGVLVHTDAAQSVGKVPVQVDSLGVDLLSLAGHKLYAPKGVGALYVRSGTPLRPVLLGAGHEKGLRPGTENVASIVGLGVACEIACETLAEESNRVRRLRDRLLELLSESIPGLALNGDPEARLPNTLNLRFPRIRGSALLIESPVVAASTGSACHESGETASPVLTAMGIDPEAALGAVRLSLGRGTTESDVVRAAKVMSKAWKKLRAA